MKNPIYILILFFLGLHVSILQAWPQDNLIVNSTFEGTQIPPDSWQMSGTAVSPLMIMQEGDLRLLRLQFEQAGTGGLTQNVQLMSDTKAISVTAWLRGSGIQNGGQDYQRGCFEFLFLDAKGNRVGGFPKLMVPNSQDWQHFTQIREVPTGASALRVSCVNYGGKGTFDFANLSIVPLAANQLLLASQNAATLEAHWQTKDRYAIFAPGEAISLQFTVHGQRAPNEQILWQLLDDKQQLLDKGQIPVTSGSGDFKQTVAINPQKSGYFEVHARLMQAGTTLPKRGTAPAGCVTFGILPNIEALPLEQMDDSRFGVQGTTFIQSGQFMKGDPYNAYYKALGVNWVYRNRRLPELESEPGNYKPRITEASLKNAWPYDWDDHLATIVDAHGIPQWLVDGPDELQQKKKYSTTFDGQKYPPRDYHAYGDILEKVAREAVNLHQYRFTYMKNNYYQIQWEPDWYWLGSDEQFINLYRTAYERIHEVDPSAKILGCNFGVLQTGNDWLERMLPLGLGKYMDGIVTHTYYTYNAPPETGIRPQMQRLVKMVRQYMGPNAVIHQTEWGEHWGDDFLTQSVPPTILRKEMSHVLRGHLIILGEGAQSTWFFYATDHGNRGFGLAYNLETPPRFGPTIISPKPLTMGVATMTRLLEGTTNLGTVDYLGDNVLGYAFDRAGTSIMALWSMDGQSHQVSLPSPIALKIYDSFGNAGTLEPDSQQVTVMLSDLPIYVVGLPMKMLPTQTMQSYPGQAMDMPGSRWLATRGMQSVALSSPQIPSTMPTGTWLLSQQDATTGTLSNPKRLEVAAPLELQLLPALEQGQWHYQLKIHNCSSLSQTLSVGRETAQKPLEIAGGQTTSLFLQSDQLRLDQGYYIADAMDQTGHRLWARVPAKNILRTFKHTPTIDGNWQDWQLEMFQRVSGDEALAYRKAPLAGPRDFSFDYALAYDNKAVYGIFKVSDDKHQPPINPNEVWRGDSIQIALGMDLRPDGNWASVRRFSLQLAEDQQTFTACQIIGPPPLPPMMGQTLSTSQFASAVHRDDAAGLTIYEFAIPWSEIADGDHLAKMKSIGFGALVNDADTIEQITGDARKTMAVGGGVGLFATHPKLGLFPLDTQ